MKKLSLLCLLSFSLCACSSDATTDTAKSSTENRTLILATTTSVNDTGLLDILSEKLQKERNIILKWISVGTGKALAVAKNCDADMLLVHAPQAEKNAIQEGYVQERIPFMQNYFVLVGPKQYAPQYANKRVSEILTVIASMNANNVLFVSRGDDSGTHKKEQELWKNATQLPNSKTEHWYLEAGQGMLQTLSIANEKNAFTLTDMATWLHFKEKFPKTTLTIISDTDPALLNTYSVLFVSTKNCPKTKDTLAREIASWLLSKNIQKTIAEYKVGETPLFTPLYMEGMPK